MLIIKRYINLCNTDIKYSIMGLICGCIGSYYNVNATEHTSRVMLGDFSNERLYLLFYTNV